ncbi:MAG: hypothetical protein HLX51_12765 [Micrococcaceae bacterium]|nr:hypothetical protein [Micrococcaceae bacterium]
MCGPDVAAAMVEELRSRMPNPPPQQCAIVVENDLVGRAVLALLWEHRSHLTIYLLTHSPAAGHELALQSGIASVRNAPDVHLLAAYELPQVLDSDGALIWAVEAARTDESVQNILVRRNVAQTWMPLAAPFDALTQRYPVQTAPSHELILRDIIRDHARFLNFFGDRLNPKDLYERSKYPAWIAPPQDFMAAVPPMQRVTTDADGNTLATTTFDGALRLHAEHMLQDHRTWIELDPILQVLDEARYDIMVTVSSAYENPNAKGALAVQIHRGETLMASIDIATSPAEVQVPIRAVPHSARLRISVVALKDNPRTSWSKASHTELRVAIHPEGTYAAPRGTGKAKAWLKRFTSRRQPAT